MSNSLRGETAITIDGKERAVKFTLGALSELQQRFEVDGVDELLNIKFTDLNKLIEALWIGLKVSDPDIMIEDIASGIDTPIMEVINAVQTALILSLVGEEGLKNVLTPEETLPAVKKKAKYPKSGTGLKR